MCKQRGLNQISHHDRYLEQEETTFVWFAQLFSNGLFTLCEGDRHVSIVGKYTQVSINKAHESGDGNDKDEAQELFASS